MGFAAGRFLFRTVEPNSERVRQDILACSSRCPPLKKRRGAFKLELALMRLYLTKPSKRRRAAIEPIKNSRDSRSR